MRRRHRRLVGALSLVVAVGMLVGAGSTAASADDPTFPTWAQVQAAKASAAAKAAEVAKIRGLIATVQAQAAAAGKAALVAGETYLEAQNALAAATATSDRLALQAKAAKAKAAASSREAGQLAAQLARSGHGNISLDLLLNQRSIVELPRGARNDEQAKRDIRPTLRHRRGQTRRPPIRSPRRRRSRSRCARPGLQQRRPISRRRSLRPPPQPPRSPRRRRNSRCSLRNSRR